VDVRKGRFGPYIQHGNRVANLPRGVEMEEVTLDQAVQLLTEKGKELKPKAGARGKAGKTAKSAAGTAKRGKTDGEAAAEPKPARGAARKTAARKPAARKTAAQPATAARAKAPARRKGEA
jgi:DNA topoisomerase-1